MAVDAPKPSAAPSRARIFWLVGILATALIVYLSLPKTWFHPPESPQKPISASPPGQPASESIDALRASAAKTPRDFGARSRYGMALFAAGRSAESLAEFKAAASLAPEAPVVHHNLGVYYLSIGRPTEADLEFCRELEITPGSGRAHFFRGQALLNKHKDSEAVSQFKLAIALAPDFPEPYLALAGQLGDLQSAQQTAQLVEKYLRYGGNKVVADFVLSRAYRAQHQYAEAARYGELTVQANPDSYAYWHNLGQIYSYARRFADAEKALKRALELAKDKSTAYIELGMNSQSAGKTAEAIEAFKNALQANPGTGNIHLYLARAYQRLGDQASARREEEAFRQWSLVHGTGVHSVPNKVK